MSNLDGEPAVAVCGGTAGVPGAPVRELLPSKEVMLGPGRPVRRLLPTFGRRMVGAWCFLDHYGPDDISGDAGMQVAPHPHTGLQTVSWLHAGDVLHRDSLGSLATVRPGELGLMTAGRGISHSEESPVPHRPVLHGAQLWVALPDGSRGTAPAFAHHTDLPVVTAPGAEVTVFLGEFDGALSPGEVFSPLLGADAALASGARARLPLEPDFEYAALTMSGDVRVDGDPAPVGRLLYLGCGRDGLRVEADSDARLILLGGVPFEEKIVMFWNFVGRTGAEIEGYRNAWAAEDALFGAVHGYAGPRIPAPPLPGLPLKPRGRTR
ncbi:pirin family protein [Actinocorallia longicatena]|uniref:Pirin family protein n=1 Tax=Actinocorallia longicatena TaxID=111803 RepID=A0ABP6Q7N5_9ACTN